MMKSAHVASVLAVALFWALPTRAEAIKPEDAARHVGETVVVQGMVAGVGHSQRSNTTFINFCKPYPDQCFAALIFSRARLLFEDPQHWAGERILVAGKVNLYRGKPEIILEQPAQVRVVRQ